MRWCTAAIAIPGQAPEPSGVRRSRLAPRCWAAQQLAVRQQARPARWATRLPDRRVAARTQPARQLLPDLQLLVALERRAGQRLQRAEHARFCGFLVVFGQPSSTR